MSKFTEKQLAFVANKAAGVPNREAAIAAGYGVNSAKVTASQLMQRPDIKAAIRSAIKAVTVSVPSGQGKRPTLLRGRYKDSMSLLMDAMNCEQFPIGVRIDCAKALLPYQHARLGETGKKEKAKERAREVTRRSKFGPKQPPKLHVVGGKVPE